MTDRAKAYEKAKFRLSLVDLFMDLGALLVVQFFGLSAVWSAFAARQGASKPLQILFYLFIFFHVFYLLSLPLSYYSGFALEKKYALSTQTRRSWFSDAAKRYALSLAVFLLTMEAFLLLIEWAPRGWWLFAAAGWFVFSYVFTTLFPRLVIPLFYPVKPLAENELKNRLVALCKRFGVPVKDVCEIALSVKTEKANAAVVGMGKSRRIFLGDTLLKHFTPEEIEMVLAHELGHEVRRHVPKSFIFHAAFSTAGFYLLYRFSPVVCAALGVERLSDTAVFPMLVFLTSVAGLLFLPLANGFSRFLEREADRFALSVFPLKGVFASVMEKLASRNLADPDPHPWREFIFYSHPSIRRRIRHAEAFLSRRLAH